MNHLRGPNCGCGTPAAPIQRDGKPVSRRAHQHAKRLRVLRTKCVDAQSLTAPATVQCCCTAASTTQSECQSPLNCAKTVGPVNEAPLRVTAAHLHLPCLRRAIPPGNGPGFGGRTVGATPGLHRRKYRPEVSQYKFGQGRCRQSRRCSCRRSRRIASTAARLAMRT